MHLRAKYRRPIYGNLAVKLLCQELNEVLNTTGTHPCPKGCETCHMIKLSEKEVEDLKDPFGNAMVGPCGNTVIGPSGNTVVVEGKYTCKSKNVIYFIYCRRKDCRHNGFRQAYVGQTTNTLQLRMTEHRNKINNKPTTLLAKHFSTANLHTAQDCKVCVIKEYPTYTVNSTKFMVEEENRLIEFLGTKHPNGLNMI